MNHHNHADSHDHASAGPGPIAQPAPPGVPSAPRPPRSTLAWLVVVLGVGLVGLLNQSTLLIQPPPATPEQRRAIAPDEEMVTRLLICLGGALQDSRSPGRENEHVRLIYQNAQPDAGAPERWAELRRAMLAARAPEADRHALRDLLTAPPAQPSLTPPTPAPDEDTAVYLADAADVAAVLDSGSAGAIPAERAAALIGRHGIYAHWLLSAGQPVNSVSELARLTQRGLTVLVLLLLVGAGAVLAVLSGVVLLMVWLVRTASPGRRPAAINALPVPPQAERIGPRIAAVFVAGFVGIIALGAVGIIPEGSVGHTFVAHFALLLALILTVALTGRPGSGVALGLTPGRGPIAEIGAGALWWLGTLPLVVVAALLSLGLVELTEALWPRSGPPKNPVADALFSASPGDLVMLALLAAVWAPVTEELVFRGGILGPLGRTLGLPLAVALSSLGFALMHSYELPLLMPVLTLGLSMAVLRVRRGSLIACVTMHALHNSVVIGMTITLLTLLRA